MTRLLATCGQVESKSIRGIGGPALAEAAGAWIKSAIILLIGQIVASGPTPTLHRGFREKRLIRSPHQLAELIAGIAIERIGRDSFVDATRSDCVFRVEVTSYISVRLSRHGLPELISRPINSSASRRCLAHFESNHILHLRRLRIHSLSSM